MQITLFVFFLSNLALAQPKNFNFENRSISFFCSIFNFSNSEIASFPNLYCDYDPEGFVISAGQESISLIDKYDSVVWQKKGHFHHQVKWNAHYEEILVLTSKIISVDSQLVRDDVIEIFDRKGNIKRQIDGLTILKLAGVQLRLKDALWFDNKTLKGVKLETTHFNSFYSIPVHKRKNKYSQLPPGGYILNSISDGVFVLSNQLDRVLLHFKYPLSIDHRVHDAQVNSAGNIIFFNNEAKATAQTIDSDKNLYSTAVEYDPFSKKTLWTFMAQPKEIYYSQFCGGIQELDSNTYLISDYLNGFLIVRKNDSKVIRAFQYLRSDAEKRILPYQDIKLKDLSDFFSSRKKISTN